MIPPEGIWPLTANIGAGITFDNPALSARVVRISATMMDLADLDAFAAVAQARSFRGAAAVRGVSASTLSEAVRRLEARLGLRLLNRTTRSVTPTEAGAQLFERLAPALGEVSAALDAVNSFRDSPTGTLRLNVPNVVARLVLPPVMPGFLATHPGIILEVTAEDSFVDVLAAGFDAGVRYDERLEQDMIAVPIGPRVQRFAGGGGAGLSGRPWPARSIPGSARSCLPSPPLRQRRHPALGVRARRARSFAISSERVR